MSERIVRVACEREGELEREGGEREGEPEVEKREGMKEKKNIKYNCF